MSKKTNGTSTKVTKNTSTKVVRKTNASKQKPIAKNPIRKKPEPIDSSILDDVDEIDIDSIASASTNNGDYKITTGKKTKAPAKAPTKKSIKVIKNDDEEEDNNEEDKVVKKTVAKKTKTTNDDSKTLVNVNNIIPRKLATGKKSYILVIVESPGKINKLGSILGPGYVVASSFGHIMDLHPKKMSVDIDNNFDPEYHIITGKKKFQDKRQIVKDLIAKASGASKVIIAADHDREGEMIGWSYKVALGLDEDDYERITFNSITKDEVKHAIANPGKLDMLMVDSQKTRRILDRLVGFKISPGLNQIMGMRNLSAGRVQSIVVRLICEKEQEINKFFEGDNSSYFRIVGDMSTENPCVDMKCELFTDLKQDDDEENENDEGEEKYGDDEDDEEENDIKNKMNKVKIYSFKSTEKLMNSISESVFKVSNVTVRNSKRYPSAPYTTSTAQQDSSTRLGFNVKRTMTALQRLYEAGYTTYLRTDSTNLSKDALQQCTNFIKENYGDDYHNLKNYTNKKGNTQEAHEAIRPVDISKKTIPIGGKIGSDEHKMYQLVWKRTVASQMAPAEVDIHNINISISKEKNYIFRTSIDDITFPGFLAVYNIGIHGQEFDNIDKKYKLTIPKKGNNVVAKEVRGSEEYKKPPMRYSEAGLVKKMDPKNLNIGRPATYAEIINTIQKRNYVEVKDVDGVEKKSRTLTWNSDVDDNITIDEKTIHLGREKKKFVPTQLGVSVNSILLRNFPNLMEYQFTATMETELDNIAEGEDDWTECLTKFWKQLKPLVEKMDTEKKVQRILGKNPDTGYDVIASMGFHGPMLTMARSEKKSENATAPIKPPYTLEKITLKQAITILKYPKILGVHKRKNVELKTGQFGFYVTCGDNGANIPKDINPDDITLETALEYLEDKQKQYEEKMNKYLYYHKDGNIEYIINTGKFGENNRYLMIKDTSKKNAKPMFLSFPSDEGLEDIEFDRVKELAEEAKTKRWQKTKTPRAAEGNAKNISAKSPAKAKAPAKPRTPVKANVRVVKAAVKPKQ
jgi:DNA topoisomerase I